MELWEALSSVPVFDHHAHNVRKPENALPFEAAFTESFCPEVWRRDTPHGLFLRRSVKQLAPLFDCEPELESVKSARAALSIGQLTQKCFEASRLCGLILDDGLAPEEILDWNWHQQFVPTQRLLRVEMVAENLLTQAQEFEQFTRAYRDLLENSSPEVVGFKSIVAYRGGLEISAKDRALARADFNQRQPQRLSKSPFYHFLLHEAFEIASERALPFQLHTGFGDPDLALEHSNPLLLRPVIERYSCPFVLLHAGYPYFRETGFLASVYNNVWTDFGLAIPFLSYRGMKAAVSGLLELCPLNKLMYSSDASLIPELFYLGSLNGRKVLADCLTECVEDGDLNEPEALEAGSWILKETASHLYRQA